MDNKLDKLKLILIQQYSKLDGITEEQLINKLDTLDWKTEFKRLNKNLRYFKVLQGLFAALLIGLVIISINFTNLKFNLVSITCIVFFVSFTQMYYNNTNTKLRLLGLLFEIYR